MLQWTKNWEQESIVTPFSAQTRNLRHGTCAVNSARVFKWSCGFNRNRNNEGQLKKVTVPGVFSPKKTVQWEINSFLYSFEDDQTTMHLRLGTREKRSSIITLVISDKIRLNITRSLLDIPKKTSSVMFCSSCLDRLYRILRRFNLDSNLISIRVILYLISFNEMCFRTS